MTDKDEGSVHRFSSHSALMVKTFGKTSGTSIACINSIETIFYLYMPDPISAIAHFAMVLFTA